MCTYCVKGRRARARASRNTETPTTTQHTYSSLHAQPSYSTSLELYSFTWYWVTVPDQEYCDTGHKALIPGAKSRTNADVAAKVGVIL